MRLVRHPELTLEDDRLSELLCAQTFSNDSDPEQAPMDDWSFETTKRFPYAWTVIRVGKQFAGYTFVLPANERLMRQFVSKQITERELSARIRDEINLSNYDTAYLIASVMLPQYEGRGLALRSIIDSVEKMNSEHQLRAVFAWPFTDQARRLAPKLGRFFERRGLEFYLRSD